MKFSLRDTASFLIASRIPNQFIITLTQVLVTYFLLHRGVDQILDLRFLLFLLSTTMIGAGGYIINDYFDQKIDLVNRPNTVVVGTQLRRRLALLLHAVLSMSGVAIGFFLDSYIGIIHIFSSVSLWIYSGVLKRQVLIGTLTISFLSSLTLLSVLVYHREFSLLVMAYAMFAGVSIFIRESIKDVISVKGETAFGILSIPIVWGIRGAKTVIYLAGLAGVSLMTFYLVSINNWNVRYFFGGVFFIVVWTFYKLSKADKLSDFEGIKKNIDVIIILGLISMILI